MTLDYIFMLSLWFQSAVSALIEQHDVYFGNHGLVDTGDKTHLGHSSTSGFREAYKLWWHLSKIKDLTTP